MTRPESKDLLEVRLELLPVTLSLKLCKKGRTQAPTPLPTLPLPPELLSLVFSSLEDTRNPTLAAAARVSKAWSEAAYRELYGEIRVKWVGRTRKALVRSFEENPDLYDRMRKVTVHFVTMDSWDSEWDTSPGRFEIEAQAEEKWPLGDDGGRSEEDKKDEETFTAEYRMVYIATTGESGWLDKDGPEGCEQAVEAAFWAWAGQHTVSSTRQFPRTFLTVGLAARISNLSL